MKKPEEKKEVTPADDAAGVTPVVDNTAEQQAEAERIEGERLAAELLAKDKEEAERIEQEQLTTEQLADKKSEIQEFSYNGKNYKISDECPERVQVDGCVYAKNELMLNQNVLESMVDSKNIFITEI